MADKHPSEIAREALKRLALRHMAPTPANYQACYNEIANLPNVAAFPELPLRNIAQALVGRGEAENRQLELLSQAITRRSWQGVQEALVGLCGEIANRAAVPQSFPVVGEERGEQELTALFKSKLAALVDGVKPALGEGDGRVGELASQLFTLLLQPTIATEDLQAALSDFVRQAAYAAEEQSEIRQTLLKLLHLIIENIAQLSVDDSWLRGQTTALLAAVEPPLTLRRLDDVERRLKDVIYKQSEAKSRSMAAQAEIRQMLAIFVEHLASINMTSSSFQEKIEASVERIENVDSVEDLADLLKEIVASTRHMVADTSTARNHLQSLQERVLATEAELVQLHLQLDSASSQARHDPLTDTLNRKGLDEALAREIANLRRKGEALSLCLLDIDNFKKINDRLGHQAGDEALIHLVEVTRRCMRAADTLARYGGEEFVILMPDTALEAGVEVIRRLQRELTRNFFLAGNEKILITFSAGVVQLNETEPGDTAVRRADQAMYLAKRAGKNRVVSG